MRGLEMVGVLFFSLLAAMACNTAELIARNQPFHTQSLLFEIQRKPVIGLEPTTY